MNSLHASQRISPVTAVLGPTNTGKTHLAVERMLAHGGGMIGQLMVQMAKRSGASTVVLSEPIEMRRSPSVVCSIW